MTCEVTRHLTSGGWKKAGAAKVLHRPHAHKVVRFTFTLTHWRQESIRFSYCLLHQLPGLHWSALTPFTYNKEILRPPRSSLPLSPFCCTGAPKSQASKRSKADRNGPCSTCMAHSLSICLQLRSGSQGPGSSAGSLLPPLPLTLLVFPLLLCLSLPNK